MRGTRAWRRLSGLHCSAAAFLHECPPRFAFRPERGLVRPPLLPALPAAHFGRICGARENRQTEAGSHTKPECVRYLLLHARRPLLLGAQEHRSDAAIPSGPLDLYLQEEHTRAQRSN